MCFTVNVNLVKEELERIYGRDFIDHEKYRPSYYYHAFSQPSLPVVAGGNIELMEWGLIPEWVKDRSAANEIRKKTYNARSETLSVKPSFAASFKIKRCVVPVAGFYEWQHRAGRRIPWYITMAEGGVMHLGGLWSEWADPSSPAGLRTFTIITTPANNMMAAIHNTRQRMPLVIDERNTEEWLSPHISEEEIMKLMIPFPDNQLNAFTIGPLISKKTGFKNTPGLIRPFSYDEQGELFQNANPG